jgi:hypothetical protein
MNYPFRANMTVLEGCSSGNLSEGETLASSTKISEPQCFQACLLIRTGRQVGQSINEPLGINIRRVVVLILVSAILIAMCVHVRFTPLPSERDEEHQFGIAINGRLNVLDFGGLFSGNAIGPARSVMLRWETRF